MWDAEDIKDAADIIYIKFCLKTNSLCKPIHLTQMQ